MDLYLQDVCEYFESLELLDNKSLSFCSFDFYLQNFKNFVDLSIIIDNNGNIHDNAAIVDNIKYKFYGPDAVAIILLRDLTKKKPIMFNFIVKKFAIYIKNIKGFYSEFGQDLIENFNINGAATLTK